MQRISLALPQRLPASRVSVKSSRCVVRVFSSVSVEQGVMEKKRRLELASDEQQKQKKVLSLRKSNARSARSICYIQIFGTGMDTGDTSPSVLLFFDSKRFVFNAGEGLQRFCQENRIKLSKIDHVLLTRVCSETSGGLAGTLLTLAGDVGLTINIWGPSDLQHLVTAMSTFLPNASVLYTHAFGNDGKLLQHDGNGSGMSVLLEDELVKISAILLLPEYQGTSFKPGDISVVYVCELPEVKGKFDPNKAVALGLRPGKKYAQLQNGCSVFSDDGTREIFPCDVLEPSSPGPKFLLVDCPTTSHLPQLLTAAGLEKFYKHGDVSSVSCIVHMGPAIVVNDSRYRSWMDHFGSVTHIVAGPGCSHSASPVLRSSAKILTKLKFACPYVFPLPGFTSDHSKDEPYAKEDGGCFHVPARNLLKFRLLPLSGLGIDESAVLEDFDAKVWEQELLEQAPDLLPLSDKVKELWKANNVAIKPLTEEPWLDEVPATSPSVLTSEVPDAIKRMDRQQVELVFLGTGSSHPSTYRNVSAIYVHCFDKGGVLLDCGEGTYGQLIRRFGAAGAETVISRLRCIWISHIHADHHGGIARILSVRRQLLIKDNKLEPLLVVGPKLLRRVLEAYEKVEDLDFEFLDCSQTTLQAKELASAGGAGKQQAGLISSSMRSRDGQGSHMQNVWLQRGYHLRDGVDEGGREKLSTALRALGMTSLVSIPVIHCPHAFGVVIEAGWKLAYSGDTRPCNAFIQAAQGATVFIHEATFEDGMSEEAISKMHSSTQEAIQAGVLAQAFRIILTHFSQRYSKVPVFDESYNDHTCVAFDLMSIDFVDLPLLPTLVPVFKLIFKDDQPEEEANEGDG